jgi:hypothetical protein
MPYTMSWYLPDRILMIEVVGVLTAADTESFAREGNAMVKSGTPLVHMLIDIRQGLKVENIPASLRALQANPPLADMGWVLIVGGMNPLISVFTDLAGMVMRIRYRRFETLDEGLAFLKERDVSLPSL